MKKNRGYLVHRNWHVFFVFFLILFSKSIAISLKKETLSKIYLVEEGLDCNDIDNIGNLKNLPTAIH